MGGRPAFLSLSAYTSQSVADAQLISDVKVSVEIDKDAIAILRDKSGNHYQIRRQGTIRQGTAYSGYDIQSTAGGQVILLGGGKYDGSDGGCGQGDRKEVLGLDKAIISPIDFKIEDINKDRYLDVYTQFEEEDCKTGQKVTVTNVFYATEDGFQQVKAGE